MAGTSPEKNAVCRGAREGRAARFFIGVDLGGRNLRVALAGPDGDMLSRFECETGAADGPEAVIGRLATGIAETIGRAGVDQTAVSSLCVGMPGILDRRAGVVKRAVNLPGWKDVPLARIVGERFGAPVFLENDANCAGWGEYVRGAGRGAGNMALMTLGTGVGGAIVLDGRLHVGRDGSAGEIGHVTIVDGGRPCACGARGCVEAYASASAATARFGELVRDGWPSPFADSRREPDCEDIFRAAGEGDPVCLRIVRETGHYLGVAASVLAELLNPDRCVVSGGMTRAGPLLFDAMRAAFRARNRRPSAGMEIVPAALGENAGLVGAAEYARNKGT